MALGEQLRNARLRMNLTASQVAAGTRMKVQMVEQIESEDFHNVAAPIYGKGFIKLYAEYVGLDAKPLIDEYMFRFVDHNPGAASKSELPKDDNGSGIPTVLKTMEVPEESEPVEKLAESVEEEVTVKPVKIERPREITKPASVSSVGGSEKTLKLNKSEKTPEPTRPEAVEKTTDFGTAEMPDLFDTANVSKQAESRSLAEEAVTEMDAKREEDTLEEPAQEQVPLIDIISDVCEYTIKKSGELIVLVKDKVSDLFEKPSETARTSRLEKSELSKEEKVPVKADIFENPTIMVASALVIIAVVLSLMLLSRKPSIKVPVEGENVGELELVEEPPPPYVD